MARLVNLVLMLVIFDCLFELQLELLEFDAMVEVP